MYRNLVTSLLDHERVRTTDAKAKGVRSLAEKMITLGKRGDLHARRRALRVIRRREIAAKVFDDLAERYRERPGGYTRILKLGIRPGDAAAMSIIELVEAGAGEKKKAKPAKKTTKKADKAKSDEKKKVAASKDDESAPKTSGKKKATAKKKATSKKKAAGKKKSD
jgi:large subunit ribosomal protein L17